jgi:hypothetical protein
MELHIEEDTGPGFLLQQESPVSEGGLDRVSLRTITQECGVYGTSNNLQHCVHCFD